LLLLIKIFFFRVCLLLVIRASLIIIKITDLFFGSFVITPALTVATRTLIMCRRLERSFRLRLLLFFLGRPLILRLREILYFFNGSITSVFIIPSFVSIIFHDFFIRFRLFNDLLAFLFLGR
jgi:hypothetical protein